MTIMSRAAPAFVGARGFDTTWAISAAEAAKLKAAGMNFAVRYLHTLNRAEADAILAAGLALMPVTYSYKVGWTPNKAEGTAKGKAAVSDMTMTGLPRGATLWLDLEGVAGTSQDTYDFCAAFYDELAHWGAVPGIYVGAEPNLTSEQLYKLPFRHYWKGQSQLYGSDGRLVEPQCGWQMVQLFPSIKVADTLVDVNFVQQDYKGRVPTWAVAD